MVKKKNDQAELFSEVKEEKKLKLSPTGLNLYLDCPCCFWLANNKGIKRPSGPMSTLPGGVDNTLKLYFDHWRKQNEQPPLLEGKLKGKLLSDQNMMDMLRSNKFGFMYADEMWFGGKLDDALVLDGGVIIPLDNKTYGYGMDGKEINQAYLNQMSAYTLMLKNNNIKTANKACLIYYHLNHKNFEMDSPLKFNIKVMEVETRPDEIEALLPKVIETLKGEMPEPAKGCAFCGYRAIA